MSKTYRGKGVWTVTESGRVIADGITYQTAARIIRQAERAARAGLIDGREARRIALEEMANARKLAALAAEEAARNLEEVRA